MSVDFKLAMPSVTGNLPAAGAKGGVRKSLADAGQFGAILAGGKAKAGEDAPPLRNEAARPDTDWKARKNIWATRDLKDARQPDDADEVAKGEQESGPDAIAFAVPPAQTVLPVEAAAGGLAQAGAEQPPAAGVSTSEPLRGKRETNGKDDPRLAGRSQAAAVVAASGGTQAPAGAQAADASPASAEVPTRIDAAPAGETDEQAIQKVAEAPVGKDVVNREAAPRDRADAKVTVVSSQVSIPPAAPTGAQPLSSTGSAFVTSLASDGALPQYVSEIANAAPVQDARPVTTLKIQLHPAELGTVTVQLSGAGEQLEVEVQVENAEARHRLATDSDAIVKALRGMGYDIDRITVQQAPPAASSQGGGSNRENAFTPQEGRSGERQEQPARQGTDQRHEQNARGGAALGGDRDPAGGSGVYI